MTYRAVEKLLNPISINYLNDNNGQLSSTIQYANITALIMLTASIIVQDKISKNLIYKYSTLLKIFLFILPSFFHFI